MNWQKYSIDEWLEQFGIWCEKQRLDLPDGLAVNQIYWLMQSVNPTPTKQRYCHIDDNEALEINRLLCETMKIFANTELLLMNKCFGFSLREVAKIKGVKLSQVVSEVNNIKYYLAGRTKTTP